MVCILEDEDKFVGQRIAGLREQQPSRQRNHAVVGAFKHRNSFVGALSGFHGTLCPHLHMTGWSLPAPFMPPISFSW